MQPEHQFQIRRRRHLAGNLAAAALILLASSCEQLENFSCRGSSASNAAPPEIAFSYGASQIAFPLGYPSGPITPTVQGLSGYQPGSLSFSVEPAIGSLLPGIDLDPTDGTLEGTGTSPTPETDVVVKATGKRLSDGALATGQVALRISIIEVQPLSPLVYDYTEAEFDQGQPIVPDQATITGGVTAWSVDPALPPGITLSLDDGTISGTPSAPSVQKDYVVTASNPISQSQATLRFSVKPSSLVTRSVWSAGLDTFMVSERDGSTGRLFPRRYRRLVDGLSSLAAQPDGRFVFVSAQIGSLFRMAIDPLTGLPQDEVEVIPFNGIDSSLGSLAFSPDGTRLLGTSYTSTLTFKTELRSIPVDPVTGALGTETRIQIPDDAAEVLVHPIHPLAYVPVPTTQSIQVYEIEPTLKLVDEVALAYYPIGFELSDDGRFAYVPTTVGRIGEFRVRDPAEIQAGQAALTPIDPDPFQVSTGGQGGMVDVEAGHAGSFFVLLELPGRVVELDTDPVTGALSSSGKPEATIGPYPSRLLALEESPELYVLDPSSRAIWHIDHAFGGPTIVDSSRSRTNEYALFAVPGAPAPEPRSEWIATTSRADATVRVVQVEPDGVLLPAAQGPVATVADPIQALIEGERLYVVGAGGTVQWFGLDRTSGALDPLGSVAAGLDLRGMVLERSGDFAYVLAGDSGFGNGKAHVHALAVADDGSLTPAQGGAPAEPSAVTLAIEPSGEALYVVGPTLEVYVIQGVSGFLNATPPSSPLHDVGALTFHPNGRFAYVSNPALGAVHTYALGDPYLGELTEVAGSPFTAGTGTSALALDRWGYYLAAANENTLDLTVFDPDRNDGSLAQLGFSPVPTSGRSVSLAFDAGLRFLFAGLDSAQPGVSSYAFGVGGSAFGTELFHLATGAEPLGLAADTAYP